MDRISDKHKCMAALAVFRDLYNQNKDIYSVIAEFIKLTIVERGLINFDLNEMAIAIRNDYGFDLPVAVIKSSLKRLDFLDRSESSYTIKVGASLEAEAMRKHALEEESENNKVIDALYKHVESQIQRSLSPEEKEILCNEFCAFIIEDSNPTQYGDYISQYILSNSKNSDFLTQIDQIRQGVVIYVGLNYNTDNSTIDRIDNPLFIYLDTEILFHLSGLNGTLYKQLTDEFYALVQETNKAAKKEVINLRYFSESEDEINRFFCIAEDIVRGKDQLDPSKQAMCNIVNGCLDAYQVVEKKSEFFRTLKDKGITLDSQEHYYDKEVNYQYVINDKSLYENKDEDLTDFDLDRKINLLNYISIKRGYKNQTIFRNVGHILLSANKATFYVAYAPSVHKPNTIPLATNLSFLTNRLWISLNKGLSNISSLKSINIITKAQIALSSRVNDNVGKLYSQFVKENKNGKLEISKMKETLATLHKSTVSPDEINAENADDYISILNIHDINSYIAEKSILESQLIEQRDEMQKELKELQEKQESIIRKHSKEVEEENVKFVKAAQKILLTANKDEQNKYDKALNDYLNRRKKYIEDGLNRNMKNSIIVAIIYLIIVVFLFVIAQITNKGHWYSYIPMFVVFLIPFIRPLVKHDKFSNAFKYIFSKKYQEVIKKDLYQQFENDTSKPVLKIYTLEEIIEDLQNNNEDFDQV